MRRKKLQKKLRSLASRMRNLDIRIYETGCRATALERVLPGIQHALRGHGDRLESLEAKTHRLLQNAPLAQEDVANRLESVEGVNARLDMRMAMVEAAYPQPQDLSQRVAELEQSIPVLQRFVMTEVSPGFEERLESRVAELERKTHRLTPSEMATLEDWAKSLHENHNAVLEMKRRLELLEETNQEGVAPRLACMAASIEKLDDAVHEINHRVTEEFSVLRRRLADLEPLHLKVEIMQERLDAAQPVYENAARPEQPTMGDLDLLGTIREYVEGASDPCDTKGHWRALRSIADLLYLVTG